MTTKAYFKNDCNARLEGGQILTSGTFHSNIDEHLQHTLYKSPKEIHLRISTLTKLAQEALIAQTLALFFYKMLSAVSLEEKKKKQNSCSEKKSFVLNLVEEACFKE